MNGKNGKMEEVKAPDAIVPAQPTDCGVPDSAVTNRPVQDGYYGAPLPSNEKERHETLCACQILDSTPDPRFDDITKLVCLSTFCFYFGCSFCCFYCTSTMCKRHCMQST